MEKKSEEMGTADADGLSQNMQDEGAIKKVRYTSIDDVLSNEILVSIFEFLPAADRMRLEFVSKKWNRLASKWSWSNYTIFSLKQFSGCGEWRACHAQPLFKSLFFRCGKFIKELEFSFIYESIWISSFYIYSLLRYLPNLRHLNLYEISLSSFELTRISESLSCLISLICSMSGNYDGITAVLRKCDKLEIMQICAGREMDEDVYEFVVLPPALKYVYLHSFFNRRSFFEQLVKQGIQLESIELEGPVLESSLSSLCQMNLNRLKYLSLRIEGNRLHYFVQFAENLSQLEALEFCISGEVEETPMDELLGVVVSKCPNLKHFRLGTFQNVPISEERSALLASLPKLCSVHFWSFYPCTKSVFKLFRELSLTGRLQFFHTQRSLPAKDVRKALVRCKNLTGIFCGPTKKGKHYEKSFDLFLATLDKIHEGEHPPATVSDKRILHTNYGNHNEENILQHPWARFYKTYKQKPVSNVKEQIRFGGVSSKPNYFLYQ